jgi:hypothetical protein
MLVGNDNLTQYEVQTHNADTNEFCNYDGLQFNTLFDCIDKYKEYNDVTLLVAELSNDKFIKFVDVDGLIDSIAI